MNLKDKVAIVTGSSSGIGEAIALKFAEEGARVVIVGRNQNKLDDVAERVKKYGADYLVLRADVTNDNDAQKIINKTIQNFGKIDILINNAGIGSIAGILDENCIEVFDQTIGTNLRSAVLLSHLAAPHLIQTKGNIINMSSALAQKALPKFSYCTSKAAMDHFSRCIALELAAKGVRVNTLNPGPVLTNLLRDIDIDQAEKDKLLEDTKNKCALKKYADADKIAELAVFLASDKARSVTGSAYLIDNGMVLGPSM